MDFGWGEGEKGVGEEEIDDVLTEAIFRGELSSDYLHLIEVEDDLTNSYCCLLFESRSIIC